jgi:hypothetical protein
MPHSGMYPRRIQLPRAHERRRLGNSPLFVSPVCIGISGSPETVEAAYKAGVNFFFLTADLHWPLYDATRRGLANLLTSGRARRDDIVVAVCSYLDQPLFSALQFHEVIDAVPGLMRVDVAIAGGVSHAPSYYTRLPSLNVAKMCAHRGISAMGASFHDRQCALAVQNSNQIDIAYIRCNTAHPGARADLFPFLRRDRVGLTYNFKSLMFRVTEREIAKAGLRGIEPPPAGDYYRFVLGSPELDGILCAPNSAAEVWELAMALDKPPLSVPEEEYLIRLSTLVFGRRSKAAQWPAA